MKIAIAGIGYVGLSMAAILARFHDVVAVDVLPERVKQINSRKSPIVDGDIEALLAEETLNLTATLDAAKGYMDARFVIVAVPTNYDSEKRFFNTSAVEFVIRQVINVNPLAVIVIKSTVPVGFTAKIRNEFTRRVLFCPEFLREGHSVQDNLFPSRIIVGFDESDSEMRSEAETFGNLLKTCSAKEDVPILLMGSTEAEAVKLFANAYLAMRVGFFNELDTYAETKGLNARNIIDGICLEPRIGAHYNNPSFGYGGYCFPKDTKQVLADYGNIPQRLIGAIVETNDIRKAYISAQIIRRISGIESPVVGIYRLTMKAGSDNFRQSAVRDVMEHLREKGIRMVVYEPAFGYTQSFEGYEVINDFRSFAETCHIIVANRCDAMLDDVREKVYTRDLFQRD